MSRDDAVTACSFLERSSYTPSEISASCKGEIIDASDLTLHKPAHPNEIQVSGNRSFIQDAPGSGLPGSAMPLKRRPSYFLGKRERSVRKEVFTTYHDQENIQVMLRILEHIVEALHVMWSDAKAIHRDISSGNILYDGVYGRLGDLEFVKFLEDSNTVHDVKTGTAEFMAVEVAVSRYLFVSVAKPSFKEYLSRPRVRKPVEWHPFRHNLLHGLESILWLMLWTMFRHYPDGLEFNEKALQRQFNSYLILFPGPCGNEGERTNMLTTDLTVIEFCKTLAPPFTVLGSPAVDLRNVLAESYKVAEAHLPITPDCAVFKDIHQIVITLIQDMADLVVESNFEKIVTVRQLLRIPKRKAEEMEDTENTEDAREDAPPQKKLAPSEM